MAHNDDDDAFVLVWRLSYTCASTHVLEMAVKKLILKVEKYPLLYQPSHAQVLRLQQTVLERFGSMHKIRHHGHVAHAPVYGTRPVLLSLVVFHEPRYAVVAVVFFFVFFPLLATAVAVPPLPYQLPPTFTISVIVELPM